MKLIPEHNPQHPDQNQFNKIHFPNWSYPELAVDGHVFTGFEYDHKYIHAPCEKAHPRKYDHLTYFCRQTLT